LNLKSEIRNEEEEAWIVESGLAVTGISASH
jgi:hypothetical protein